jgi:Homeodomain-like domain-containing protein
MGRVWFALFVRVVRRLRGFDREATSGEARSSLLFVRELTAVEEQRLKDTAGQEPLRSRLRVRQRQRAMIVLASATRISPPEIAREVETNETRVRQVIDEFNEQGLPSMMNEWRRAAWWSVLLLMPAQWALAVLVWTLAAAWAVVFGLPLRLYRRRSGESEPPSQRQRATLAQSQAQRLALSGAAAWLSPPLFLAVAAAAAVATRPSSLFPAAAANLIVSFWANGLAAEHVLTLGDRTHSSLSAEIAALKHARAIGLASTVVGAGLLAAGLR